MRDHLGIYMQGVLEVADLRPSVPPLRNPSLSKLTETFFDMPLDKSLSTSTWHHERALRQNEIEYAGTDAYAGLKLHQHFIDDHDPSNLRFLDFELVKRQRRGPTQLRFLRSSKGFVYS